MASREAHSAVVWGKLRVGPFDFDVTHSGGDRVRIREAIPLDGPRTAVLELSTDGVSRYWDLSLPKGVPLSGDVPVEQIEGGRKGEHGQ